MTQLAMHEPVNPLFTMTLTVSLERWREEDGVRSRLWRILGRQQFDLAARVWEQEGRRERRRWYWRVWPPLSTESVVEGWAPSQERAECDADAARAGLCKAAVS